MEWQQLDFSDSLINFRQKTKETTPHRRISENLIMWIQIEERRFSRILSSGVRITNLLETNRLKCIVVIASIKH